MASRPYIVRQGDYLTALAFRFGTTVKTILDDPKNKDLKERRHPEILNPLDIVYLPEPTESPLSITAQTENLFQADVPTVLVKVRLANADETPVASQVVETFPLLTEEVLKTDGDGNLALEVPVTVKTVRLEIPEVNLCFALHIGHLDPHDESAGARARLRQLGYLGQEEEHFTMRPWLDIDATEVAERALQNGIAAFLRARGEQPRDDLSPEVCQAIKDEYGC